MADYGESNGDLSPDFRRESERLATFKNWPNPNVSPESLAKAGFYYLNDMDKVKCAWCLGVVAEWELGDNAFDEHKRLFPTCPLIVHGPNFPEDYRSNGIQEFKPPKKFTYACLSARLRTYENWPRSDIQKPETLAEAGFYYTNTDDQVRCFYCNGGLRSWQKEDDPWFEHVRWFPQCNYLQLAKGQSFIDQVLSEMRKEYSRENSNHHTGRLSVEQISRSLDDAMSTEPVRLALQMGLNAGRIKSATKRRLEMCGRPYDTAEELVNAVLEGQVNEETYAEDANSQLQSEVSRIIHTLCDASSLGVNMRNESAAQSTSPATTRTTTTSTVPEASSPSFSDAKPNLPNTSSESGSSEKINESTVELMKQMSLEEENRRLKEARMCKICMDEECAVVFLPCGHLVSCVMCAPGISQCPICRSPIKGFVRTYLS